MRVFDLFAGTGSATAAFQQHGDEVLTFDNDPSFELTEVLDLSTVTADYLLSKYGQPDFVWASPPCTAFSVASIGKHWERSGVPKTLAALKAQKLVAHTKQLIQELAPTKGFVIENPRGMLRKLPVLADLQRHTVTYCQFGDTRMKPTDLWTNLDTWNPRPACKNGDPCHEPAPRGSQTGTQGRGGAKEKAMVPFELGADIRSCIA
jgi:hypothetical protein